MKKLVSTIIIFLFLVLPLGAEPSSRQSSEQQADEKSLAWLSLSAGFLFASSSVEHGALIWNGPFFFPGIGVTLFDHLSIKGPQLEWNQFSRESPLELKITLKRFDDGEPLIPLSDLEENYRNRRRATWQSSVLFRYKFGFRNLFYIGASATHDLSVYHETLPELNWGVPLIPFVQLEGSISYGAKKTHQYWYGADAEPGWGHTTWTLKHVLTKLPWKGVWINTLNYSYLLNPKNHHADFIRGQKENLYFKSILAWNFY